MNTQPISASAPVVFIFKSNSVRVVTHDGNAWFVCTDAAEAMGYRNGADESRHLDDDEKGTHVVRFPGGDQPMAIINKAGLCAMALRSRKPKARKFAKWIISEVIPAIRKTWMQGDSLQNRINRRARELAQRSYEDFRSRMESDTLIQKCSDAPESWKPAYAQIEVIEKAEALAEVAVRMGYSLRRDAQSLASIAGLDFQVIGGRTVVAKTPVDAAIVAKEKDGQAEEMAGAK